MNIFPGGDHAPDPPPKPARAVRVVVVALRSTSDVNKGSPPFQPKPPEPDGTWRMQQADIDRVQEFRKCIECYLCQDVCHVLREHKLYDEFIGPRFFVYVAALEMHPLDTEDRRKDLKMEDGIGYCNITKCCTN